MVRSEKKKRSPKALIILVFAALTGLMGVSLARESLRSRQIDREIAALQAEAERLRVKNFEISSLTRVLDDRDYLEREARLKLNLRKEGERVVVLTDPVPAAGGGLSGPPSRKDSAGAILEDAKEGWSNPKKWWAYFFSRDRYLDQLSLHAKR